jgi:hypothetical protein
MAVSEPRVRIDPRPCEGHALCIEPAQSAPAHDRSERTTA